ncbi:hypothetical protein ACWF94_21885 [Streptomyces sp. NPDC055078]
MAGVVGLVAVALLLLTMCGGSPSATSDDSTASAGRGGGDKPRPTDAHTSDPPPRIAVPAAYTARPRWEIPDTSAAYAVAHRAGRVGYLERVPGNRFRLRTLDAATGRRGWSGRPWRPPTDGSAARSPERSAQPSAPGSATPFPRLLSVAKDGREYFVAWSSGTAAGADSLTTGGGFIVLDVYDAGNGSRKRVEIPWAGAPTVSGAGPGVLVGDGRTRSAVLDPASGEVTQLPETALAHPKGCAPCHRLTEVRGLTTKGLLLSGESGFWVRGGWSSRDVAPSGTDRASGVPTSVAPGLLLAKWRPAKGRKDARTHEIWAVHDTASGKPLVQTRCHTPAIEPGEYPRAALSPKSGYLVAGNLAFDLTARKAHCFEQPDGSRPLTLTTVTDAGVAYGATNVRSAPEALAGGGSPFELDLNRAVPQPLPPQVRLPGTESAGVGIFTWTDSRDRLHVLGHPRRER